MVISEWVSTELTEVNELLYARSAEHTFDT